MTEVVKFSIELPNGAKFNVEGPADIVKDAYAAFLATTAATGSKRLSGAQERGDGDQVPVEVGDLTDGQIDKMFLVNKEDVVSLRVQPKSSSPKADAILLVLLGYRAIRNLDMVPVSALLAGMKETGLPVGRIDKTLGPNMKYVNKGGTGRGNKYGLNNLGVVRAQEIVRATVG
jgi:hypothetical protein